MKIWNNWLRTLGDGEMMIIVELMKDFLSESKKANSNRSLNEMR